MMIKYAYVLLDRIGKEPLEILDLVRFLGYTMGVRGSWFDDEEEAELAWEYFEEEYTACGCSEAFSDIMNSSLPNRVAQLEELRSRVKLVAMKILPD